MMFGFFKLRFIWLAAALLLVCGPALAEKRVALVLGNSAYQNVPPLANPINDAALVAATLKEAGFDVVDSRHDLSALETRRALRDFSDSARDADIAMIYYAGHGLEVDGSNYLVPVDAKLERDSDVYDEAFSLDRILLAVEPAKQLRLVILDACRDSPFTKTMKRTLVSRAIGRGLAKIEPNSPNTLIAYSAKAGSTAQDGDGKNSPFTVALARHLTTPGLDVRRAFGFVRDDVLKSTNNRQEPFVYGSLGGDDVPLVPAPRAAPQAQAAPSGQAEARRDYELALQVGNKAALNAFLAQYPDGFYASLARLQIEKIAAEEANVAATEKARAAEAERARLAAAGAEKDAQANAAAAAKSAEDARLAAEKAKQMAQDQAAAAERKRTEIAASTDTATASPPVTTPSPTAGDRGTSVASLNPSPSQADVTKSVQTELRRVGCLSGSADGDWNAASQRSLTLFNRYAGTKFDVKVASSDALDAIKLKQTRVCPLACDHGFKADGDHCSRIVCAEGSSLNDDNECEKKRAKTPVARHGNAAAGDRASSAARGAAPAASASPRATGQIVCDDLLCRPVRRGCHLNYVGQRGPRDASGGNIEVCN
jgi:Caspase domain